LRWPDHLALRGEEFVVMLAESSIKQGREGPSHT
jgi:hypothetical protein